MAFGLRLGGRGGGGGGGGRICSIPFTPSRGRPEIARISTTAHKMATYNVLLVFFIAVSCHMQCVFFVKFKIYHPAFISMHHLHVYTGTLRFDCAWTDVELL